MIILQTWYLLNYIRSEASLYYWRTNHGAEVDLLIHKHGSFNAAVEIKLSSRISRSHLSGLNSFRESNPGIPCYLVCTAENPFQLNGVTILPWRKYLEMLEELL